jgi:protein gp37
VAERTEISWAHSTFNPWIGCTKVSPGCDHCYAATLMDDRYGRVRWGAGETRIRTKTWGQPLAWNRKAAALGKPWRVFCASLADVFDNEVPDEWRADLWKLVRATPALTWMILTKRIGNAHQGLRGAPVGRLWLGITVVNQDEAARDIPKLLAVPARVRWLSCEPLLGPINLCPWLVDVKPRVDWVIVGGESGAGARPMEADWAREIRNDCISHSVPFHFKQWGSRNVAPLLDGREHRASPSFREDCGQPR